MHFRTADLLLVATAVLTGLATSASINSQPHDIEENHPVILPGTVPSASHKFIPGDNPDALKSRMQYTTRRHDEQPPHATNLPSGRPGPPVNDALHKRDPGTFMYIYPDRTVLVTADAAGPTPVLKATADLSLKLAKNPFFTLKITKAAPTPETLPVAIETHLSHIDNFVGAVY